MPAKTSKKKVTRKRAPSSKTLNRASTKRSEVSQESTRHKEISASRSNKNLAAPLPKVHCTLAPVGSESLLLPTSAIAAVIEFLEPEPLSSTPQWFLGQIEWENRQIPVFSYAALIGGNEPGKISAKSHIMIVKSLSDSARMPYLGFLISDIPKLISVQLEQLVHTGDEKKALGAFSHVKVQDEAAVIPDLDRLTHLVTHAAYGILPITQMKN